MKMLAVAITALSFCTGCWLTSAASVFPAIAAVVSDSSAVLNIVQQAVDTWFLHKPDRELQARFNSAIRDAWTALRAATAATRGAESVSQEEYDKAFFAFKNAYAELHSLLKEHGILNGSKLSMGPDAPEQEIADPAALNYQVK